jgi:hypothetical protein
MNVWIDLDNSPHVHFFVPIIRRLREEGVQTTITARAFSQTEELARWYGLPFVTIGEHRAHVHTLGRVAATLQRAVRLAAFVRKQQLVAAVSHGSRAQVVAARMLGIPAVTIYDYEFVSSRVFYKLSRRVLAPESIPLDRLKQLGLDESKFVAYPGFKEEVYIYEYPLDAEIVSRLGLDPERLAVTLRPPATWAHYHDSRSVALFRALVDRLRREKEIQAVVLPRTRQQAESLRAEWGMTGRPFQILDHAVDGLSLMWQSDAVFSGGGTMVREAALLGVPAYSVFGGKLGAVDEALMRMGKLKILSSASEIGQLALHKRPAGLKPAGRNHHTLDFIVNQILSVARSN